MAPERSSAALSHLHTAAIARRLPTLVERLGPDLHQRLLGWSASLSAQATAHQTMRAEFLLELTDILSGAYTTAGLRAWFDRPRIQLDRGGPCTPADFLWHGQWRPDDEDSLRVLRLAQTLNT